jgi:hypothetical protein
MIFISLNDLAVGLIFTPMPESDKGNLGKWKTGEPAVRLLVCPPETRSAKSSCHIPWTQPS